MSPRALIHADRAEPYPAERSGPTPMVSLDILPDTLYCMLGRRRNRTPCFRLLGGVEPPRSGVLRLLEHDALSLNRAQWLALRRRIGFVARTAPLLSVLNGWRNVMLPALYHRVGTPDEIEARASALVECMDYGADHAVLPAYMSYLQRQHLAIARALILEPEVLFISDPFNGLEPEERALMRTYLAGPASDKQRALVVTTNDLSFVSEYAERIVFAEAQELRVFESWSDFCASERPAIQEFLSLERKACGVYPGGA